MKRWNDFINESKESEDYKTDLRNKISQIDDIDDLMRLVNGDFYNKIAQQLQKYISYRYNLLALSIRSNDLLYKGPIGSRDRNITDIRIYLSEEFKKGDIDKVKNDILELISFHDEVSKDDVEIRGDYINMRYSKTSNLIKEISDDSLENIKLSSIDEARLGIRLYLRMENNDPIKGIGNIYYELYPLFNRICDEFGFVSSDLDIRTERLKPELHISVLFTRK